MSGADAAFDRLLEKNAIGIPVANPGPEPAAITIAPAPSAVSAAGAAAAAQSVTHMNASVSGDMSEAMRVLDLLDDKLIYGGGDYHPPHYSPDENEREFTTPTETELEPVPADSSASAAGGGDTVRRVLVPDMLDDDGIAEADAAVVDDAGGADTQIDIGGDAEIRKARRVRRFAYIPLGGMESFENRARDVMAGLASREPDKPSLAITSPSRGGGRTEIAVRLALSMAKRVDYRVLLADFDLRRPQIAARLGLSGKYFTLADVLRGSCPLGESLFVSEEDNLYVLPARASDRDGDEVLSDKQTQALMTKIHAAFDFAVISCGAADHAGAAIVCRHAGAAAIAAFRRRSSARAIRSAADALEDAGANIAGILLTGA